MIDLSILIVSFNTKDYLEKAIESILKSRTSFSYEIIVVDNHSADGTKELLESRFAGIRTIFNSYNEGFAVAMNQGYRISSGKYILAFNPDAEMMTDTIDTLIQYLEENQQIGLLGGGLINNGNLQLPGTGFPLIYLQSFRGFSKAEKKLDRKEPFRTDWIWGSGLTARREFLKEDILFEEKSFLFGEEYYLAEQVKLRNAEVWINPSVRFIHHGSVTFKTNFKKLKMATLLLESNAYLIRSEHYGVMKSKFAGLVMMLDSLALLARVGLGYIVKRKRNDLEAKRMLTKYYANFIARLGTVLIGSNYSHHVNNKAKDFFNNLK